LQELQFSVAVKLDHGPTHPRLGRTRAHAPVAAGIACSGTSRRSTKQGTAFRRRICAAARRGWISRRRPHLCYRFCPSKSCAGSRFCFAPGSPKGIGQRVTLSAKRVTKSDNIGQHGTQLVGARCGIVRHRRCPNPRLPRSTPSAYSRRGPQGEQGHTRAKGGGRQHSDAVRHFAPRRSI
jgi:hypothetical protein